VRLAVDLTKCQGYAQCAFAAPDVFTMRGDEALLYDPNPDEAQRERVLRAVAACPVQAIKLDQTGDRTNGRPRPAKADTRDGADSFNHTGRIVIVGASLAGLRAAAALRKEGFSGALTLIGDEPYEPYDRPPLSKQVLSGLAPAEMPRCPALATSTLQPDDIAQRAQVPSRPAAPLEFGAGKPLSQRRAQATGRKTMVPPPERR